MKVGLPLKLGIAVVLLFTFVIALCLLWTPVRYARLRFQLLSGKENERQSAVSVLVKEGIKSLPFITDLLNSNDDKLRIIACEVLQKVKPEVRKPAMQPVYKILEEPYSEVTDAAVKVLLANGDLNNLIEAALNMGTAYLEFGILNLEKWDSKAARRNILCYFLIAHEGVEAEQFRLYAAWDLAIHGDKHARKPLLQALKNPEFSMDIRRKCAHALCEIGERGIAVPIGDILIGMSGKISFGSESLMRTFAATAENSSSKQIIELYNMYEDKYPYHSLLVESAMRVANRDMLPIIMENLPGFRLTKSRIAAIKALGKIGAEESLDLLINHLEYGEEKVRITSAEALANFGGSTVEAALEKASKEDYSEQVKNAAINSLSILRAHGAKTAEELLKEAGKK
ncbi:MAG: HEAT repeat domain-containing protein [Planctomycetota bacterium]|nr:MAG: HEAT repeat domain-containing protein [Planctomycetota bacterium]